MPNKPLHLRKRKPKFAKMMQSALAVRRPLTPERKVFTTTISQSLSAAGIIASLCNVAQGSDIMNRIGRHIQPLYIDYVITVFQSSSVDDVLMISFFLDNAAQSTTPVFSDVFDISVLNAGTSLPNIAKTGSRYHPLLIRDMPSNQSGEGAFTIRGRVRVPRIDMEYYASTTAYPYNKGLFFACGSAFSANISLNGMFQMVFEDA
jgi:hypothetical protein